MRERWASPNPQSRFEPLAVVPEADDGLGPEDDEVGVARVELLRDPSRTIVATNQSPDLGFDASVNPYRGCSHACRYCYARPTHEYLGLSAGLDFETKILVKRRAPELLRQKLAAPSWKPRVIAFSGVTDAYQPAERRLRITRQCLEVLVDFRNPVAVVTKSWLVARDADLLADLAADRAASVLLSLTTLDPELQRSMEPGAPTPSRRLAAIGSLARAGVPVGVLLGPVIPGLNDHEIPALLHAAADAGAGFASYVTLRLPHGVKDLFEGWLEHHAPDRRSKVMNRVRAMHGARLYDSRYGVRQRGSGVFAEQVRELFELSRRRAGLAASGPDLSTDAFRRPGTADDQLRLF